MNPSIGRAAVRWKRGGAAAMTSRASLVTNGRSERTNGSQATIGSERANGSAATIGSAATMEGIEQRTAAPPGDPPTLRLRRPRACAGTAALLVAAVSACSPGARSSSPPGSSGAANEAEAAAAPAPTPSGTGTGAGAGPVTAEYRVTWRPADGSVLVEATMTRVAGPLLVFERGMASYLHDLEIAPLPAASASGGAGAAAPAWVRISVEKSPLPAPACATACRVRYRFALREAALAFSDLDWASLHGDLVEAPPSTWLVAPAMPAQGPPPRLRFSVITPPGQGFATGVFRTPSSDPAAPRPASWEITLEDLWTSPYTAFGALTSHPIPLPGVPGGTLELAIGPGETALPRADLVRWVSDGARAVSSYWGRFPMPGALVLLAIGPGGRVGNGKTLSGGGGTVIMRIGARATMARLQSDWVLVHELSHLGFPSVPRQHLWAQEGIASYVEPFARVRAGILDERAAWRSILEGMPNGLPAAGDRGLDHTPTWGRIYWGGALYWFLCDLEIRKRTGGKLGLEHALRGILAAGGNNAVRWPLLKTLELGDRAVGQPVLVPQYQAMKDAPYPVDLDALFAQLGARLDGDQVIFDDTAPLASIRRAMTFGTDAAGTP